MNMSGKEIIGLIPAAGKAERISPLPCSKEIFPVGFQELYKNSGAIPKVVSQYLLERMRFAGALKIYIVIRHGKWDIPAYFGDGKKLDMHIAYLIMGLPFGVPYTLNQAYPFIKDAIVLFGFPDILFEPEDAFNKLLDRQAETESDIVLGLFHVNERHRGDMVALDDKGRIENIEISPKSTNLNLTWIIALWTTKFSIFMNDYIQKSGKTAHPGYEFNGRKTQRELFLSEVIKAALKKDLHVETVIFSKGIYLDIGTPENLTKAVRIGI
jgi:glucose-1-phosphate thymidylyltransferase